MSENLRERLAEALVEHEADVTSYDAGDIHGCRCGWELTTEQKRSEDYGWDEHRAHVTQALLPIVEREIAAARGESLRDFAAKWARWIVADAPQIRGGAAYRALREAEAHDRAATAYTPPEDVECCASGRCEVCAPGYTWGRGA